MEYFLILLALLRASDISGQGLEYNLWGGSRLADYPEAFNPKSSDQSRQQHQLIPTLLKPEYSRSSNEPIFHNQPQYRLSYQQAPINDQIQSKLPPQLFSDYAKSPMESPHYSDVQNQREFASQKKIVDARKIVDATTQSNNKNIFETSVSQTKRGSNENLLENDDNDSQDYEDDDENYDSYDYDEDDTSDEEYEEIPDNQSEKKEIKGTDLVESTSQTSTASIVNQNKPATQPNNSYPELVVSVVTSRTVVNNTIVSPVSIKQTTTTSSPPQSNEESTDSWIVVASVQTSRSMSGGEYISPNIPKHSDMEEPLKVPESISGYDERESEEDMFDVKTNALKKDSSGSQLLPKPSTESLLDKLDRVQSDLSSSLLAGGFDKENIGANSFITNVSTSTMATYPPVNIRKFDASNRPVRNKTLAESKRKYRPSFTTNRPVQSTGVMSKTEGNSDLTREVKQQSSDGSSKSLSDILTKIKLADDISSFLPPDYMLSKSSTTDKSINDAPSDVKFEVSSTSSPDSQSKIDEVQKAKLGENDIKSVTAPTSNTDLLSKIKITDDISAFLPPGYKIPKFKTASKPETSEMLDKAQLEKPNELPSKEINLTMNSTLKDAEGIKSSESINKNTAKESPSSSTTKPKEIKLVFPGKLAANRKSRLTTPIPQMSDEGNKNNKNVLPKIQKGWPVRSSTEFTGWPSSSTTPLSIEKLLESIRKTTENPSTVVATTIPTTSTTTTPVPTTQKASTTPGICFEECDLAGTIKLVEGARWVPELLDRNTEEWQTLANSIQNELESVYKNSNVLKPWYRKIRIDGFSEGSILVDYLVELTDIGRKLNTEEIRRLFHDSLTRADDSPRQGKSLNETTKVNLGRFKLDPKFTDFYVIPKQSTPTVTFNEDSIVLPQWAIAVIVIGLASLLFVVIFGVTVLFNRHKNSKKNPTPLTEDMLNELNRNHMGGLENYGANDFYNMDDAWSDKSYDQKIRKQHASDFIYDRDIPTNDSWRSQWTRGYGKREDGIFNTVQNHHIRDVNSRASKYDMNF